MSSPVWKGAISLAGEIDFPAHLFSGPRPISIELSKIHTKCLQKIKWTPRCDCLPGRVIPWDKIGQGYDAGGEFTLIDEGAIAAAKPAPSETLLISSFAHSSEVEPLYFESTYYLAPREDGEAVYAALLLALMRGYIGLGKFVLRSRDRYVALCPGPTGIIAHTLFFEDESNRLAEFRVNFDAATHSLRRRISKIVGDGLKPFQPAAHVDEYRRDLRQALGLAE